MQTCIISEFIGGPWSDSGNCLESPKSYTLRGNCYSGNILFPFVLYWLYTFNPAAQHMRGEIFEHLICKDWSRVDEKRVGHSQAIFQNFVTAYPILHVLHSNFSFICHQLALLCLHYTLRALKGVSRIGERNRALHLVIFHKMKADTQSLNAIVVLGVLLLLNCRVRALCELDVRAAQLP